MSTAPDLDQVIASLGGDQPAAAQPADGEGPAQESTEAPEPVYPNADAWVRDIFVNIAEFKYGTSAGRADGRRWCSRWWGHPYALDRLESLWRAWEALRLDPGTGLSTWYRDHFTPAVDELTASDGPFHRCGPDRHENIQQVPALPAPESILAHFADKASPTSHLGKKRD